MKRSTPRRGFTIVELCVGMLVTTLVAFATATFTTALFTQWHDGSQGQMLDVSLFQARAVIGPIIQSSRQVSNVFTSPNPSVFIWQNDSLNGADQVRQFGEMALIEYDTATQTIYYYQADSSTNLANNASAMQTVTDAALASSSIVTLFKSQTWLKPRRALLGPGRSVDSSIEVARVTAASFQTVASSVLPQLQWSATLARGGSTVNVADTLTVRSPTTVVVQASP